MFGNDLDQTVEDKLPKSEFILFKITNSHTLWLKYGLVASATAADITLIAGKIQGNVIVYNKSLQEGSKKEKIVTNALTKVLNHMKGL